MKTIATTILIVAAFVLICGEVTDNSIATFLWVKAAGFLCAYLAYKVAKSDGRITRLVERVCRLFEEEQ